MQKIFTFNCQFLFWNRCRFSYAENKYLHIQNSVAKCADTWRYCDNFWINYKARSSQHIEAFEAVNIKRKTDIKTLYAVLHFYNLIYSRKKLVYWPNLKTCCDQCQTKYEETFLLFNAISKLYTTLITSQLVLPLLLLLLLLFLLLLG